MFFLYHNFYSIFLLCVICLITSLFIYDRKQIKSLIIIPFNQNHEFLYFERNLNFSFLRFLYLIIISLITSSFIMLMFINIHISDFLFLIFKTLSFFVIKYFGIFLFGHTIKKNKEFKKITIISIDIKTLIVIYFFPILITKFYYFFLKNNKQSGLPIHDLIVENLISYQENS